VFETAALIQSPAKCEVRTVIRFLNTKGERGLYWTSRRTVRTSRPAISTCFFTQRNIFAGKKFDDDDEVQEEIPTWFRGLAADFYDSGIQKLVPRLNKCLDNAGDYVEK